MGLYSCHQFHSEVELSSFREPTGFDSPDQASCASSSRSTRQSRRRSCSSTRCSSPSLDFPPPTPTYIEHYPPFPKNSIWCGALGYDSRHYDHGDLSYQALPAEQVRRSYEDDIDALDLTAFTLYHHEGPYDIVSRTRDLTLGMSQTQIFSSSNSNVEGHPAASVVGDSSNVRTHEKLRHPPPGTLDREGHVYEEDDGSNIMVDAMSLQGYKFTDDDFKDDPFYNDPYPKVAKKLQKQLIKLGRWMMTKSPRERT